MVAGEMNSAPTNIVQAFEDEAFKGSGRNEFRPYNVDEVVDGVKCLRV
jgi:hypothetical protein